MKILKPGVLREAANIKFFRCQKCGCIFKATEFEYRAVGYVSQRFMGECESKCPCCGYPACRSFVADDLADYIVNSYSEVGCPPVHPQKNPLCSQADGCRECWATWLKQEAKNG